MKSVDAVKLGKAIEVFAKHASQPGSVEVEMLTLVGDNAVARRLIDWIPEAFGAVLISHMELDITLPQTFMAKDAQGLWQEFPLSAEPIFAMAVEAASVIYHEGPREVFLAVAPTGCMVDSVKRGMDAGADLRGAYVGPPSMLGIPAETYSQP